MRIHELELSKHLINIKQLDDFKFDILHSLLEDGKSSGFTDE